MIHRHILAFLTALPFVFSTACADAPDDVFLDGEPYRYTSQDGEVFQGGEAGAQDLFITWNDPGSARIADSSSRLTLALRVDAAALVEGAELPFDVETRLRLSGLGSLGDSLALGFDVEERTFGSTNDGAVRAGVLSITCFCAQRERVTQRVAGTLTFERVTGRIVEGRVDVEAFGLVPSADAAEGPPNVRTESARFRAERTSE